MLQKHAGNLQRRQPVLRLRLSRRCSDFTGCDGALFRAAVVERIFCELFCAGECVRSASTAAEQLQRFRRLFVFTNCFFACNVRGGVRRIEPGRRCRRRADMKIPKSVMNDFTFNAVARCCGFPHANCCHGLDLHCFSPGRYDDVLRRYPGHRFHYVAQR